MKNTISVTLAKQLKAAGLDWQPGLHDFFMIPDTHFDDRKFVITDVQADLAIYRGTPMVTFHGALEWALDHVRQQDVVWLPTESQLREELAIRVARFSLQRIPAGYECRLEIEGQKTFAFSAGDGNDAYGEALHFVLLQEKLTIDGH